MSHVTDQILPLHVLLQIHIYCSVRKGRSMSGILWVLSLRALILTYPHLSMSTEDVFPPEHGPEATLHVHHLRHTQAHKLLLSAPSVRKLEMVQPSAHDFALVTLHHQPFFFSPYARSWIHSECKFRWGWWHREDDQGKSIVARGWTRTQIDFSLEYFLLWIFKPWWIGASTMKHHV